MKIIFPGVKRQAGNGTIGKTGTMSRIIKIIRKTYGAIPFQTMKINRLHFPHIRQPLPQKGAILIDGLLLLHGLQPAIFHRSRIRILQIIGGP